MGNDPMAEMGFHERFERIVFGRMPEPLAASFTANQKWALKAAFGGEIHGLDKPVDLRGVVSLPRRRWYFVLLAGPERRGITHPELDRHFRPPALAFRSGAEALLAGFLAAGLALIGLYLALPTPWSILELIARATNAV